MLLLLDMNVDRLIDRLAYVPWAWCHWVPASSPYRVLWDSKVQPWVGMRHVSQQPYHPVLAF